MMEAADSYWLSRLTEEQYARYRTEIKCLLDSENEKYFVKSQSGSTALFGQINLEWQWCGEYNANPSECEDDIFILAEEFGESTVILLVLQNQIDFENIDQPVGQIFNFEEISLRDCFVEQ